MYLGEKFVLKSMLGRTWDVSVRKASFGCLIMMENPLLWGSNGIMTCWEIIVVTSCSILCEKVHVLRITMVIKQYDV